MVLRLCIPLVIGWWFERANRNATDLNGSASARERLRSVLNWIRTRVVDLNLSRTAGTRTDPFEQQTGRISTRLYLDRHSSRLQWLERSASTISSAPSVTDRLRPAPQQVLEHSAMPVRADRDPIPIVRVHRSNVASGLCELVDQLDLDHRHVDRLLLLHQ